MIESFPDAAREALAEERAVNERYLREARDLVARMGKIAVGLPRARNEIWAGTPIKPAVSRDIVAPLVGRVALDADDALLGDGFYIGSWHQEWDGTQVISWVAPVACLFYSGPHAVDPLAPDVAARRTFTSQALDIVDLVDDIDRPEIKRPFGRRAQRRLEIPTAPAPAKRPATRPAPPPPPPRPSPVPAPRPPASEVIPSPRSEDSRPPAKTINPSAPPTKPAGDDVPDTSPSRLPTSPATPAESAPPQPEPSPPVVAGKVHGPAGSAPLRAERAVRQAIERPRTGRLSSVLATLQPDQFRLVTWPAERPLVVQGHPGTGKTVIATHRAAFLTHPERNELRLHRVGFVGPTTQYVEHVKGALAELDVEDVHLLALPQLLVRLAGLPKEPETHGSDQLLDTDWKLARIAGRAVEELRNELGDKRAHVARVRHVVTSLVSRSALRERLLDGDAELSDWVARLQWAAAQQDWRFLPFLAAVGLAVQRPPKTELFDHIIIDEAQDVRPLEWRIITSFLKHNGSISVFGDINQRRSDWTANSWSDLAKDLELTDDEGRFEEEVIDVGYRSTEDILRFANRLLPRTARQVRSLRSGPTPFVHKTSVPLLAETVLDEAVKLCDRHPDGLVAVLSMDPRSISDLFRKRRWMRAHTLHAWEREGRRVIILHPTNARGLEFDGVIVVEPVDFPENVGRLGLLYTSLTRATKELAVVHSKPLPTDLRQRRR